MSNPQVQSRGLQLASGLALAAVSLALALPAHARVVQISVTCMQSPTFGGASFGTVGQYELIQGTIAGEVDPRNPQNAVIVDLEYAPRKPNGTVGYSSDFQIIRPIDPTKGNHRLIFDLPNRGGATALATFNNGSSNSKAWCPTYPSTASVGNGFLMNQGYTLVEAAWDITASQSANPALFGVTFPVATHPDGSPITGPSVEEFDIDINATPAIEPLHYPAASADPSKATLTVRENYGDTPKVIPSSGWAYTDATNTAIQLTGGLLFGGPGTYSPTALYEFTYEAANPTVAGLGFASLRDFATFLRNAKTDDLGNANPLAGDVQAIITTCVSQPCRTTRDFLLHGFNEPERMAHGARARDDGSYPRAFDGMINWIGGGDGIFMNYRFAQPTRTSRQHIARWYPEAQFPWANQRTFDPVTGRTAGRLDACLRSDTCPKVFELNSENEYWSKAGSLLTTDTRGNDLPLWETPDVRYYQMASLPHGAGSAAGICAQPQNPLNASAVLRALTLDMDAWITQGTAPPHNRVPTRAAGTLVPALPQSGMGFPAIPAAATGNAVGYDGLLHTGDLFDFGPFFQRGILDVQPPVLLGSPYPVFVPKTDADGNDIAGIRLPEIAVPLATYTGWALRAAAPADPVPVVDGCDASGQRIPFLATRAERLAAGDPRLSIAERYPDHATYVGLVTEAATRLGQERLLIDADVQAYIKAAQAASVP